MAKSTKKTQPFLAGSSHATAEASPGFLFWRAFNAWSRLLRAELDRVDLTQAQYSVLATLSYLGSAAEHVSQQDVAAQLAMDKMMVSDVVKSLEGKALLMRKPHPHDGRAFSLRLTAAARRRLQQAVPLVEGIDQRFFGTLKPAELRRFAASLVRLSMQP